jgi:hypothetical protein
MIRTMPGVDSWARPWGALPFVPTPDFRLETAQLLGDRPVGDYVLTRLGPNYALAMFRPYHKLGDRNPGPASCLGSYGPDHLPLASRLGSGYRSFGWFESASTERHPSCWLVPTTLIRVRRATVNRTDSFDHWKSGTQSWLRNLRPASMAATASPYGVLAVETTHPRSRMAYPKVHHA